MMTENHVPTNHVAAATKNQNDRVNIQGKM